MQNMKDYIPLVIYCYLEIYNDKVLKFHLCISTYFEIIVSPF